MRPWVSGPFVVLIAFVSCLVWRATSSSWNQSPDPAADAQRHPLPDQRSDFVDKGSRGRSAEPPPSSAELAVLATEARLDSEWQARLKSAFLRSLNANSPDAAPLLEPFVGRPSEIMAGLTLAAVWPEVDPHSAFAWLRSLPPSDIRQSYYESAGETLGGIDPYAAIGQAEHLEKGWDRREYLKAVVIGWQENDFNAALAWADQLNPGPERNEVLIPLLSQWSQLGPLEAMKYVASRIPEGAFQEDAAFNVASNWLRSDPQAVGDWVESSPPGELRDKLVLLMRNYQERTIKGASGNR